MTLQMIEPAGMDVVIDGKTMRRAVKEVQWESDLTRYATRRTVRIPMTYANEKVVRMADGTVHIVKVK